MARSDYKRHTRSKKGAPISRGRWFASGVAFGVLVTVVLFKLDLSRDSLSSMTARLLGPPPRAASRVSAGEREPDKPRFEFYTMLPEMEVAVPEEELQPAAALSSAPEPQTQPVEALPSQSAPQAEPPPREPDDKPTEPRVYILQVGSFRSVGEAERMRANLALIGLEATIQTVAVDGEAAWHRVRIGPYRDLNALNNARVRLRENGIDVEVWRIRG